MEYVKQRKQFGKSISDFQNTQFQLASMGQKIYNSRLIIQQAARAIDEDHPDKNVIAAMAKKSK